MTNINDILLEGARRLMPHAIDEHRSVVEAAVTIAAMIAHADPSVLVRDDGTASLVVDIGGAEVIVVAVSVSDGTVWAAYVGDVRISWSQSDPSSWPQHAAAAGLSVDKCRWTVKTLSKSTPWLPEEFAAALSKSLDPAGVVFAGQRDGVREEQAMGREPRGTVCKDALRDLLTKQTRALMPEFTGDVDDLRAEDIVAAWERSIADGTTKQRSPERVTPAPLGPLRIAQTRVADLPTDQLMAYLTQQVLGAQAEYMTWALFDELSKRLDRDRRRRGQPPLSPETLKAMADDLGVRVDIPSLNPRLGGGKVPP